VFRRKVCRRRRLRLPAAAAATARPAPVPADSCVVDDRDVAVVASAGPVFRLLVGLGDHLLRQVEEEVVDAAVQLRGGQVVLRAHRSCVPGRKMTHSFEVQDRSLCRA